MINFPYVDGGKLLFFYASFMIRHSIGTSKVCYRNLGDLLRGRFDHACGGLGFGDTFIIVVTFQLLHYCYDILCEHKSRSKSYIGMGNKAITSIVKWIPIGSPYNGLLSTVLNHNLHDCQSVWRYSSS